MTTKKRAAPEAASEAASETKKLKTSSEADLSAADRTRLVAAIVEPGRVALDIPEILESVLSFLPPRTLFGVQRVSHLWKSTIAASPPIQEKMFLRLRTKTSEIRMLTNPRSVPRGWNRGEERPGLDWNFRIVGDTEMQSGSWKIKSGELQHLLTFGTHRQLPSRPSARHV